MSTPALPDERVIDHLTVVAYETDATSFGLAGLIMAQSGPVPAGVAWLVERIALKTSDGFVGTVGTVIYELYSGARPPKPLSATPSVSGLREMTPLGSEAVADESSPVRFEQGEVITHRWTGLTNAAATWAMAVMQIAVVETIPPVLDAGDDSGELVLRPGETPPREGWN